MTKLNELRGYKDIDAINQFKSMMGHVSGVQVDYQRTQAIEKFCTYLKSKGFTLLGNGAFGIVFTHPNLQYCIKVFKNDPAYLNFVKIVLKNKNIHFPKFYGRFMRVDQDYYAVRCEILNSLKSKWNPKQLNNLICSIADYLEYSGSWKAYDLDYPQDGNEIIENTYPALIDAMNIIKANSKGFTFDIHQQNVMVRGMLPVITDPCYNG